jgi:hypothetical protein
MTTTRELIERLLAHAALHDAASPHDEEQAAFASDLREAAAVVASAPARHTSKKIYVICVKNRGAKVRDPISAYDTRAQAEAAVAVYRLMEDAKEWVYTIQPLRKGWVDRATNHEPDSSPARGPGPLAPGSRGEN